MDTKEKLLRETESTLRAVLILISSPRGVRLEKLLRDYREFTFKTILFKELGYPRLENFLQSIPSVARAEIGPDGKWIVKGVASDADKHAAKLISKQKKPTLRKSAKSTFPKRRVMLRPPRMSTPIRKPAPRPPIMRTSSNYVPPPRMQRLHEMQNRNTMAPPGRGNVPVRKPAPRPPISRMTSKYVPPPRMQRLQEMQNRNTMAAPGQGNVKLGKGRGDGCSWGGGGCLWTVLHGVHSGCIPFAKTRSRGSPPHANK